MSLSLIFDYGNIDGDDIDGDDIDSSDGNGCGIGGGDRCLIMVYSANLNGCIQATIRIAY